VHSVTVVGDIARLSLPTVLVTASESPDVKEEEAARQCVEALARAGAQLSFIVNGSAWRRLVQIAVAWNAEVLLWSVEPVRVKALQLHNELAAGLLTVVSIANDDDPLTPWAYQRTRRVAFETSRAQLITDAQPEWMSEAALLPGRSIFFVKYASGETAFERLVRLGAYPIGRSSESKAPNIGPIMSALRSAGEDDAVSDSDTELLTTAKLPPSGADARRRVR
jgi:hypothetical protein